MGVTQSERFLLSLEGAIEHSQAYEVPLRFSQNGLCDRLGMAQSHISRASKSLIEEGLIVRERRRVVDENRRVLTYIPTEKGIIKMTDLDQRINHQRVLSPGDDGLLVEFDFIELLEIWRVENHPIPRDMLCRADMLRIAPSHDELPLLERENALFEIRLDSENADIASEAVGLLLELANIKKDLGLIEEAVHHLTRAAQLHRQRGSPSGEATCLLAAFKLNGEVDQRLSHIDIRPENLDADWWQVMADALEEKKRLKWLKDIWYLEPGLPIAGHVGFALHSMGHEVLDDLFELFKAAYDVKGMKAVELLRE